VSTPNIVPPQPHSAAWVVQAWLSFVIAVGVTGLGILCLPADLWIKAFMGMGLLFTVASSLGLAKTLRDLHEAQRYVARIDEARFHRLITEHDPLSPPA
jgi:hypothetical protein